MNNTEYLKALLSMPVLSGSVISPNGRWVAWSWSRIGPAADVFVAPTDGSEAPIRLTETADDTMVVSWTPDSLGVVVEQDHDGDERVQLFRVDLSRPLQMVPLTEASPNFYIQGGDLHPNGRWLIYGANLDARTGEEIEASWIYRRDLKTGDLRVLARPDKGGFLQPQLNAPGDFVLYHRNDLDPSGCQAWLIDIEGREDREILNFGSRAKISASWFPDGRRVLFTVEAESYRKLGVWSVENGSVRWLIDDPQRNIEYAFAPPNGGPVVVVEMRQGRVEATLLDVESGSETRPPRISGNFVPLAPVGSSWVGLNYSARQPNDLFSLSTSRSRSLTRMWERVDLSQDNLTPAEDFRWKSVDGLEIQGWLYRAREQRAGTVVLIHGGPTSVSEDRFNAQIQFFVSQGFNVFCPNYRGSTGFGLEFEEKIKEDGWGGREQEDIRTGIEALIEAEVAVPGKVGVTGTSYGGYSAWCAITRYPPDIVAASAPICGMTDLAVDYYSTRPDLRPYSEEMMGGSPEEVPERYRERSPINYVKNIRGRLLIVQGQRDPNVTPENVHAVVKELEKHNIPYDLLTFEDEGHGITRPKNLRVLYPRLARFFEEAFRRTSIINRQ